MAECLGKFLERYKEKVKKESEKKAADTTMLQD